MTFEWYVQDLAKRGMIDGNMCDALTSLHNKEVKNPVKLVRDTVEPILLRGFASATARKITEEIDNCLFELSKKLEVEDDKSCA